MRDKLRIGWEFHGGFRLVSGAVCPCSVLNLPACLETDSRQNWV